MARVSRNPAKTISQAVGEFFSPIYVVDALRTSSDLTQLRRILNDPLYQGMMVHLTKNPHVTGDFLDELAKTKTAGVLAGSMEHHVLPSVLMQHEATYEETILDLWERQLINPFFDWTDVHEKFLSVSFMRGMFTRGGTKRTLSLFWAASFYHHPKVTEDAYMELFTTAFFEEDNADSELMIYSLTQYAPTLELLNRIFDFLMGQINNHPTAWYGNSKLFWIIAANPAASHELRIKAIKLTPYSALDVVNFFVDKRDFSLPYAARLVLDTNIVDVTLAKEKIAADKNLLVIFATLHPDSSVQRFYKNAALKGYGLPSWRATIKQFLIDNDFYEAEDLHQFPDEWLKNLIEPSASEMLEGFTR